jgi:hypothetical protein
VRVKIPKKWYFLASFWVFVRTCIQARAAVAVQVDHTRNSDPNIFRSVVHDRYKVTTLDLHFALVL